MKFLKGFEVENLFYFLCASYITIIGAVFGWFGILCGTVLGVVINIINSFGYNEFSFKSLLASLAGSVAVSVVYLGIKLFLS